MEDIKGLSDALRDIVEELKYSNELREKEITLLEILANVRDREAKNE